MLPSQILVPGEEIESDHHDSTERFTIVRTIRVNETARGGEGAMVSIPVQDNQIYEYHFDDDTVWISDPGSIDEVFPGTSEKYRGVASDGAVALPASLTVGITDQRGGGVRKVMLKILKIFVRKAVDEMVASKVKELAAKFEERALSPNRGIQRINPDFELSEGTFSSEGRNLLFIHGTASSTKGSFEGLKHPKGEVPKLWDSIRSLYDDHIFAFEHRSLTQSPLENVRDLIAQLPGEVTLHLVTQSRGGLVGDLLCRFVAAANIGADPFNDTELEYLEKHDLGEEIQLIRAVADLAKSKKIRIEKYIRVACPAGGSTLASRRLDNWLNAILNVAGYAAGSVAAPVAGAFKELLMAVVETKDDPGILPGLAPQNPESPICKVINNPNSEIALSIPLIIISGDNEFTFKWRGLMNILTNLFFLSRNDFVVNTNSMYKGPRRAPGTTVYYLDRGDEVTHFRYFENDRTRMALSNALKAVGTSVGGFSALPDSYAQGDALRGVKITLSKGALTPVKVSGRKPVVVLLPGIMGSNLHHSGSLLWIDFFGFTGGSLAKLAYNGANNQKISADSAVGDSYAKLYRHLSDEYDVLVFPFDWRKDMRSNAGILNGTLDALLQHNQPIKLVGHSMGGVLVRDWMVFHPETVRKLEQLDGFRILFLGSPLQGSFRIASVLYGEDPVIKQLALIDFKNTKKELLEIFVRFPGILALLPNNTDSGNDFAQKGTWTNMNNAHGDVSWPVPDEALLKEFEEYRDQVKRAGSQLDYSKAIYIAGLAEKGKGTVSGYEIVPRSFLSGKKLRLKFLETGRGDGSVTWDSGIPLRMRQSGSVYYSNVTHGELANDESLFLSISDLLKTGRTSLLSRQEPSVTTRELGDVGRSETRGMVTYELAQTETELMRSLLGLYSSGDRLSASRLPLQVSVTHGDLKYAQSPLLIGHFEHDGIWSAERAADKHLNQELSRRKWLGLYPGPVGSSLQVLPNDGSLFPGVIIAGLGIQGELNERVLQTSIEQAVKQYLAGLIHASGSGEARSVTLSSLLIGSGYGGLSLDRVMLAVLTGIQNANADIRAGYAANYVSVARVEFIELFQDQALAASRTLKMLERQEENRILFTLVERGMKEVIGRQKRINFSYTSSWWSRVTVRRYLESDHVSEERRRGLRFTISTDAARVEERPLFTAGAEILSMLKEASELNQWSPELAKTLFEFLIPNDFKPLIKRQGNMIWQVDDFAASFPWELLQDDLERGKPLSVNSGMVRQLSSQDFRVQVKTASGYNALVIADPKLKGKFPQLPGALDEGNAVAEKLKRHHYSVHSDFNGTSDSILKKLCVRPYKIVHLAGHGVFEYGADKSTGMVIGPDSYLTPAHIGQIGEVPELVFINCCYLGKTDAQSEELSQNRYRLAANIGIQLIKDGVKAVVAGGWAVSDQAALFFANRFYDEMINGEDFGSAVLNARRAVFDRFGDGDNTWGAYQCYGDPSYKLDNRASGSTGPDGIEFETDDILLMELSNLLHELDLGHEVQGYINRVMAIEAVLSPEQKKNARIVELLAQIYVSFGDLDHAISYYDALKTLSDAWYTLRALEQCCNLKVKRAVRQLNSGMINLQAATKTIREAIKELEHYQAIGFTAERYNILGSAYKRLGLISAANSKKKFYREAANSYKEAFRLISSGEKYYPLTNYALLEYVISKHDDAGISHDNSEEIRLLLDEYKRIYEDKSNRSDYWSLIALYELPLFVLLIDGFANKDLGEEEGKMLKFLENLKRHTGHRGNWAAVSEQLDFLKDLFEMLPTSAPEREEKLRLIREVKEKVGED